MQGEGREDTGKAPALPSCRPRRPEGRWIASPLLPPSVWHVNTRVQCLVGCLSGGWRSACAVPPALLETPAVLVHVLRETPPPSPPPPPPPVLPFPADAHIHLLTHRHDKALLRHLSRCSATLPTLRSTPEGRWDPNKHYTHSNGILHSASAESHSESMTEGEVEVCAGREGNIRLAEFGRYKAT